MFRKGACPVFGEFIRAKTIQSVEIDKIAVVSEFPFREHDGGRGTLRPHQMKQFSVQIKTVKERNSLIQSNAGRSRFNNGNIHKDSPVSVFFFTSVILTFTISPGDAFSALKFTTRLYSVLPDNWNGSFFDTDSAKT